MGGVGIKIYPSLICVKFLDFDLQCLSNYSLEFKPHQYEGTCSNGVYVSRVSTPVDLYVTSGAGSNLTYK